MIVQVILPGLPLLILLFFAVGIAWKATSVVVSAPKGLWPHVGGMSFALFIFFVVIWLGTSLVTKMMGPGAAQAISIKWQ